MAKILFINPIIREDDKPRHIPYGMAQLVALARNDNHKIQVLDANAWRPTDDEVCAVFRADDWDVIALGGLVTSYGCIKKYAKYAKKEAPGAIIIAGGGFISPIPDEVMGFIPEIDVGVIGEGVVTFPELLKEISLGKECFHDVHGIIWRDRSGKILLNKQRDLLEDLDSLPFPAFSMFPMDIYFKNSSLLLSEEAMQAKRRIDVMASYGCPFKCKYCFHLGLGGELTVKNHRIAVDFKGKRIVRSHSPEYVIELIKSLKKEYDIDFISFIDENFIYLDKISKNNWISRFFKLWQSNDFVPKCISNDIPHTKKTCNGIHWGATAHAGFADKELLKRMYSMGCSYLDYGFESFSDRILKEIGKGATSKMNRRALHWTMEAGIRPIPNQIIGFPGETFESLRENLVAWEELGINTYPFFATPYPGSEWFDKYKDTILEQYDNDLDAFLLNLGDATKLTAVISKEFNAVELLGLRELMVNGDAKRIDEYRESKEAANNV